LGQSNRLFGKKLRGVQGQSSELRENDNESCDARILGNTPCGVNHSDGYSRL
jgi:hypothetical protein